MKRAFLAATLLALLTTKTFAADVTDPGKLLLQQDFGTLTINKIDIGDFHFSKGQKAPVHTHVAPVFGYVSKGSIYYQVEGQEPQILKTGDAFYEPVGPRILHFDNASETEEAVFTDFNLQKADQPFIVFPVPLKEKIDRRTFPTAELGQTTVHKVEVREQIVAPGAGLAPHQHKAPVVGYVAEGELRLAIENGEAVTINQGQSFFEPEGKTVTTFASASAVPVKVVSFLLSK